MRLSFLRRLVDSSAIPAAWTIQEAVDRYVRPQTATHLCCLFDVLPAEETGSPTYFISHTWSRKVGELLALLESHFQDAAPGTAATADATAATGPSGGQQQAPGAGGEAAGGQRDVVVWLDIVAINQHPYTARGCLLEDDVAHLAKVGRRQARCIDAEALQQILVSAAMPGVSSHQMDNIKWSAAWSLHAIAHRDCVVSTGWPVPCRWSPPQTGHSSA